MFRIGFGNDIHRLVPGRPLVLGGVEIESEVGAEGHSDADALAHAITDAIFGALALGDIGSHFAIGEARRLGYSVVNVDSTVSLEAPKLRPYIKRIREGLATALETTHDCVSVKAKTGEAVDAVGEERAIRAEAVILLAKD